MEAVGVAASIISIATAGIQISIKLVTLSTQVSSASERVSSIGNDVSLTSGVLHQLGELMTQKATGHGVSIFSKGGLETTRTSAAMCERIFCEIEKEFGKASEQLRSCRKFSGGKIKLSKSEKLKWPFLQPSIDILRADLREAKGTLMLMLQVTTLALSKKMADLNATASTEQRVIFRAIVALQHQQNPKGHEDNVAKKQSSSDSIGLVPAKSMQTSGVRTHLDTAGDSSPTLSHAPPPEYAQLPTVPYSLMDSMAVSHPQMPLGGEKPSNANSASVAETLPSQSEEPPADYTSSSTTLASSQCSLDYADTNTPTSIMDISSATNGKQESGRLQDFQAQLLHLEQQNRRRLIASQHNQTGLKALPISKKASLSSESRSELRMFMLKPIVKDYFDKIELSWSIQTPKMQDSVIRNHLARMEADGLPSVIDMLETLYDHEHSMIDAHQGLGELLSLKRTRTDIKHRDIVFQGVPGLQFVLEPRENINDPRNTPRSPSARSEIPSAGHKTREPDSRADRLGPNRNFRNRVVEERTRQSIEHQVMFSASRPPDHELLSNSLDNFDAADESDMLLTEDLQNVIAQGPFAGLEDCVVVSTGLVEDKEGNVVGGIVEGDAESLNGCIVNESGNVVDKFGRRQGRAMPIQILEEEAGEQLNSAKYTQERVPSVFKEVKSALNREEEPASQEGSLRKMEDELEKTFNKKVAEKDRKFLEHEEELRVRQLELDRLEIRRSKLDEEKLRVKSQQPSHAETTDFAIPRPMTKKKKFLHLGLSSKRKGSAQRLDNKNEQVEHSSDVQLTAPPSFKCQYDLCTYEGKSARNTNQHMEKAHGWSYIRSKNNGRQHANFQSSPEVPSQDVEFDQKMPAGDGFSKPGFLEPSTFDDSTMVNNSSWDKDKVDHNDDTIFPPVLEPPKEPLMSFGGASDVDIDADLNFSLPPSPDVGDELEPMAKVQKNEYETQAFNNARDQSKTRYQEMASNSPDIKDDFEDSKFENGSICADGNTNEVPSKEIFKSFRVSQDEPLTRALPAAMKKYNIKANPLDYSLYVVYEDKELCLGKQDKPLLIFRQLSGDGRKPTFMLRRHPAPDHQELKIIPSAEHATQPYRQGFGENISDATSQQGPQGPKSEKFDDLQLESPSGRRVSGRRRASLRSEAEEEALGNEDFGDVEGEVCGDEEEEEDEEEYSSDDNDDDVLTKQGDDAKGMMDSEEAEKRIVDGLLGEYTTLFDRPARNAMIQLPGGVL